MKRRKCLRTRYAMSRRSLCRKYSAQAPSYSALVLHHDIIKVLSPSKNLPRRYEDSRSHSTIQKSKEIYDFSPMIQRL